MSNVVGIYECLKVAKIEIGTVRKILEATINDDGMAKPLEAGGS